jgi:hypothetical protein
MLTKNRDLFGRIALLLSDASSIQNEHRDSVFVQPELSSQQFLFPRLFDLLDLLRVRINDF